MADAGGQIVGNRRLGHHAVRCRFAQSGEGGDAVVGQRQPRIAGQDRPETVIEQTVLQLEPPFAQIELAASIAPGPAAIADIKRHRRQPRFSSAEPARKRLPKSASQGGDGKAARGIGLP